MRAPGAVDELEVDVHRVAVAAEADRQSVGHLVEVQRELALAPDARRTAEPGSGGTIHLGIDACGHDLGGFDALGRQHAVVDEEYVGVEPSALVAGPHLGDDPR